MVNLGTGQYWLNFDGQKGMSDREGHGHKAVLYKSQFLPLRHSLLERHCCIHRLINHVYTKGQEPLLFIAPRHVVRGKVMFAHVFVHGGRDGCPIPPGQVGKGRTIQEGPPCKGLVTKEALFPPPGQICEEHALPPPRIRYLTPSPYQ